VNAGTLLPEAAQKIVPGAMRGAYLPEMESA
jgi:hypothetical protein